MPARADASRAAREWLAQKPLFLDTETTGLKDRDEICEVICVPFFLVVLLIRRVCSPPIQSV